MSCLAIRRLYYHFLRTSFSSRRPTLTPEPRLLTPDTHVDRQIPEAPLWRFLQPQRVDARREDQEAPGKRKVGRRPQPLRIAEGARRQDRPEEGQEGEGGRGR